MKIYYTLEKLVDGEWIKEGEWTNPVDLVNVAFYFGRHASIVDQIRVKAYVELSDNSSILEE